MKKYWRLLLLLVPVLLVVLWCVLNPASGKDPGPDTQPAQAHVHEFDDWAVLEEENCSRGMLMIRQCLYCDYTEQMEEGAPNPIAHRYGPWEVLQNASCASPEYSVCFCEFCGEAIEKETAPPNGNHEYSEWMHLQEPNCGSGEVHMRYCYGCSQEETKTVGGPVGEHEYVTTVVCKLGCMQDEIVERSCLVCGSANRAVNQMAQGHNMKNGKCTVCGRGYSQNLEISEDGMLTGIGSCTDTDIIVPEGTRIVGGYAFQGNTSIQTVMLPDSTEMILQSAFEGCTSLTKVVYPEDVNLPDGSGSSSQFARCTGLTSILIPIPSSGSGGMAGLADSVYRGCTGLLRIEFAESDVPFYSMGAFSGCSSVEELTIPGNFRYLGLGEFGSCKGLKTLTLEEGVETLAFECFYGCKSLQAVYLPASLTTIGPKTFEGCVSLTDIYYAGTEEMWQQVTKGDRWDKGCGEITVHFGGHAHEYKNWKVIQKKTCTLDEIRSATCSCGKTATEVAQAADGHQVINGKCTVCGKTESKGLALTLTGDGSGYVVTGIGSCKDTDIIIPAAYKGLPVTEVKEHAFMSNDKICSVTLPDSVETLGEYAFAFCDNLRSVTLSAGLKEVGSGAFSHCPLLEHIDFNGCTVLGEWMFSGSKGLRTLVIPGNIREIPNGAFASNCNLKSVILEDGVEIIDVYAFNNCFSLRTVTCTDSIHTIINPFGYCWSLHTLYAGNAIPYLPDTSFNLNQIYYAGTVAQWEAQASKVYGLFLSTYTVHCADGNLVVEKDALKV